MKKWKAEDMRFHQVWNPDARYQPEKRNYTLYAIIYHTPDHQSIMLSVNVEEGIVFLEEPKKTLQHFESEGEMNRFVQMGQDYFDNQMDMGVGSWFVFGYGGTMKTLDEYANPHIEYLKIQYPQNEKFDNPRYKEKVQWSLIEKGAIMIRPQQGERYLAVIQRKHKPRNLAVFGQYLPKQKNDEAKVNTPKITHITLPKWLASNIGVPTKEKEITIQTTIQQETEKAVLISFQGKNTWLPKSKIRIA